MGTDRCTGIMCNRTWWFDTPIIYLSLRPDIYLISDTWIRYYLINKPISKPDTCTHGKRLHPSWCSTCRVHPCPCRPWQTGASSDDRSPLHRSWSPVRSLGHGRSCSPLAWPAFLLFFLTNHYSPCVSDWPECWDTPQGWSGTPWILTWTCYETGCFTSLKSPLNACKVKFVLILIYRVVF